MNRRPSFSSLSEYKLIINNNKGHFVSIFKFKGSKFVRGTQVSAGAIVISCTMGDEISCLLFDYPFGKYYAMRGNLT